MNTEQLSLDSRSKVGAVLVVGGGIGGMQAALDLANAGFRVYLVEQSTAIGGRMAQLDKTFPTNDCSMCTISPRLIEVGKHRNIELLTNSDVLAVEGEPGRFQVRLRKRPRFVLLEKCNACGDCLEKCPVTLPSEFDAGLSQRRAIGRMYPQAIPGALAISKAERSPCRLQCPAGVNCQGYVALVSAGRFAEAYELIRQRNPFPASCGRVCHHPCESHCNRKQLDEPVAINNLKRFAADWVARRRAEGQDPTPPPVGQPDPAKPAVAVVGGGPAGLTAARDLALRGYPVTLFEANEELGGTMLLGIPSYRLPVEVLRRDIADILAAGFTVRTGQRLGRDFTLADLQAQGFKAVFLALGCTQPVALTRSTDGSPLAGRDLEGVLLGLDFLRDVKLGRGPRLQGKVVVIGGGNVAIDVAMTARRQGAQHVEIVCLERREEMPAHAWEIEDALEESITINPAWGVKEILGDGHRVRGLRLQRCTKVFDESGRFAPSFDQFYSYTDADWVIVAIGQRSQLEFLSPDDPLWDADRRKLEVDRLTLQTRVPWVFAGGDMVTGPASVVEAVAQGHEAAESIDRYLRGDDLRAGRTAAKADGAPLPPHWQAVADLWQAVGPQEDGAHRRISPPRLPPAQRTGYAEIEMTLDEQSAIAEAKRCLACGLCSECQQCVAACSAGAIIHDMLPEEISLDVGAVVLAPGFEPMPGTIRPEYGYGLYPNVVTSMEFERILSASGPYQGHVRRPSDGAEPKRIAWIQCVGSRDRQCGNDYCSSVCCMYAIKEAILAVDHTPGLQAAIFYNDIRAFGKGFESYYENAKKNYGVVFRRGLVSSVKERPQTKNLLLSFVSEDGQTTQEEFDLVVLSVGVRPSPSAVQLAEKLGVRVNQYGFCHDGGLSLNSTGRDGIYVAGAFAAPMDIPETVITASAAAAMAAERLQEVRGTLVREKTYLPERDVSGEPPRVGVFVCRCGTNIARVVGVSELVRYAATLPHVVYAEENLYTCSTDTQRKIVQVIHEHQLNRVVVASCTPRTHEQLFQETLREAGLNRHLFEMANIRDQCSWVHADRPQQATKKAKDLVRMAVARAATLTPLHDVRVQVQRRAIVLGAGVAGMTAALSLADQGFETALLERQSRPGGLALQIHRTSAGLDARQYVQQLVERVNHHPLIQLYTEAIVQELSGHVGNFRVEALQRGREVEITGGAVVVATGATAYKPDGLYCYGQHPSVLTQLELEERLRQPGFAASLGQVVMIQCVGSREADYPHCSRVCCSQAVKNALAIKRASPATQVFVLYRDMRTYGFEEIDYAQAREAGVVFIRFEPPEKPQVDLGPPDGRLKVLVRDEALGRPLELWPDLVVLSTGVRPQPDAAAVSQLLKVPLGPDGFFLEAHMKLRPLDFASEGIFLAGMAHGPKSIAESVAQAKGAAARAATVLCREYVERSGIVSEVDQRHCAACLTCVRLCPYSVPQINQQGVAYIEPASCQGCGLCATVCPRRAISTRHYRQEQLLAKVDVLFDPAEDDLPVATLCQPAGGNEL